MHCDTLLVGCLSRSPWGNISVMVTTKLVKPEYVSLKDHPSINESWLQEQLIKAPELLGLGEELVVRDSERSQPSGGRLDLLLVDSEAGVRYEVEIQLGSLDESHIIRTIEYWDLERRRYPQYEHIAVIVAENITGRFHNVISLLSSSGSIPLIAIQMKAVQVKDVLTLVATRVLDVVEQGTEEEDAGVTVDRSSWGWASKASMKILDGLFKKVEDHAPGMTLKYNKAYIVPESEGRVRNFITFEPRKKNYLYTGFKIAQGDELTDRLNESELAFTQHKWGRYYIRVRESDLEQSRELLDELILRASDESKVS